MQVAITMKCPGTSRALVAAKWDRARRAPPLRIRRRVEIRRVPEIREHPEPTLQVALLPDEVRLAVGQRPVPRWRHLWVREEVGTRPEAAVAEAEPRQIRLLDEPRQRRIAA